MNFVSPKERRYRSNSDSIFSGTPEWGYLMGLVHVLLPRRNFSWFEAGFERKLLEFSVGKVG